MRLFQTVMGAIFLTSGAALMLGGKDFMQRICCLKAKCLPESCHGMLKEFSDAGPSVLFYWGVTNTLAGGLLLTSASEDCVCKEKDA